jgi:hypothetical protein
VSVHVAFDIYPAADPNGSLLVRLLASGTGPKQAVELSARKVLHGSGEGMIRIHSSHAAATSANFTKRNYVKVVLVNGATETEWFGFFLEQGDFGAISRREQAGRMLTFSGPGSLFYLDRALLLAEIYAPGQPRRGNLELDGQWGWNDIPYGAIMTRAMEEGYYEPGNPLFYATWDFTRTEDSASVAWPNIDNEFTVPWGTSVYDLIASFIKLGLVVTVDADLTFHAWQTYGTNRTSATFAAGKIRFAHGVNIGNEVTRQIRASLERSRIFVVGDEFTSVVVSGGSSAVEYYDTLQKQETNDPATLTAAGQRDLDQREIQADAAFPVRVILDDDELNGLYVPGEHYDVGDIATIHTVPPSGASGQHDFTNFAIEVAAIKVEHDDAGNWFAVNELGAQYLSAQLSALEVPSSKIIQQIDLCRAPLVGLATFESGKFGENGTTGGSLTVPAGLTNGALVILVVNLTATWPPTSVTWTVGASVENATQVAISGRIGIYVLPNPQVGSGTVAGGGHWVGYWLTTDAAQVDTITEYAFATGTGTGTSAASPGEGLQLGAAFVFDGDFVDDPSSHADAVPAGGQVQDWTHSSELGTPGFVDLHFAGGHGDDAGAWTLDVSHPWDAVRMVVNGASGTIGDSGPMPVGANGEAAHGTAIRATRCDHVHPHSDLSDHSGETHHHASSVEVTPFGTIAATNVQTALEEVVAEATSGAPTNADYLVGTANGSLSAEIVVGTTPGGELGGTWASPTVDATHSGSTHDAATNTHIADGTDAHDASAISFSPVGSIAATDVQAAIAEVASEAGGSFTLTVEEEGTPLATGATTLDFVGAGVTATGAGAEKTITIPGGSGITVEDEGTPLATSADTLDFVGAGVTATGAGATKTITIPGGGSAWTLSIDEDGSSVANWTSRDGTWSSTGTVIRQTNTGIEANLHYTALVPLAMVAVEMDVFLPSSNATDDYIGMDIGTDSSNTNGFSQRYYLKKTGTSAAIATYQSGAETIFAATTVNYDTWYTMAALVSGGRISFWLDGTLLRTAWLSPNGNLIDIRYFGIFTALAAGDFRNIKVWTPTLPF